jgi:hypothetical protein
MLYSQAWCNSQIERPHQVVTITWADAGAGSLAMLSPISRDLAVLVEARHNTLCWTCTCATTAKIQEYTAADIDATSECRNSSEGTCVVAKVQTVTRWRNNAWLACVQLRSLSSLRIFLGSACSSGSIVKYLTIPTVIRPVTNLQHLVGLIHDCPGA